MELDGSYTEHELTDYAFRLWWECGGKGKLPREFVRAGDLPPEAHLAMQAALQPYVDNSISKTINVPADFAFESFKNIYELAYDRQLKGCTTFRPNPVTGHVLRGNNEPSDTSSHCCTVEREAD